MAKTFNINTQPVYSAIAEATAEETRKERKTYTEAEAQAYKDSLKTAGRKGVKLPRINMAFTPTNYEYIHTMARRAGLTLTEFLNAIISQHMDDHQEQYESILAEREKLL